MNVKNLIKSFNRSDNLFALEAVDDHIDNNETVLNLKEKPLKNKYRYLKKQISIVFSTSEKNNNKGNLSKTKKNKHEAKNSPKIEGKEKAKNKPKVEDKNEAKEKAKNEPKKDDKNEDKEEAKKKPKKEDETIVLTKKIERLGETSWFTKKFEAEVGKNISVKLAPFSTLEKDIRRRRRKQTECHLYQKYKEAPRPENIPEIVWEGPPLASCFCISPIDDCDCKGDTVLPPRNLPIGWYWKFLLRLYYLTHTKIFKKLDLDLPELPEKPFPQRLVEHLKAEAVIQKQLEEMDMNRGPEFCVFRCHKFYNPLASLDTSYFKLRRSLYEEYYKPKPIIVKVKPVHIPSISDDIIDGLYRSVATQAITDENCEFIIGEISHILFGRSNVYQDIEGTPYCICDYKAVVPKQSEPVVKKIQNLLSISEIKKRVSNLGSSLMSAIVDIVDIEDTGIPINVRGTQDPPLDNYYESIIVPLKYKFVKIIKDEMCPCCKKYKELHTAENDEIESKVTDIEYPLFKTQNWLRNCGPLKFNLAGKRILPIKDNPLSETIKDVKHENVSKVKNINDSIQLLRRDLITDKTAKKYKSVDGTKDLCEIQFNSMLNVEETKMKGKTTIHGTGVLEGTGKENNEMNNLEYIDSIKPCCIDNILKTLEKKVSIEIFLRNCLEDEVFRKVARYIYKKEQKRQPFIENIETETGTGTGTLNSFIHSTDAPKKKSKLNKLKSRIKINMNKFSEFIKKQKSSLKCFAKKQDPLRSNSRIASSLKDLKVKISKSFKKMNKAVSSFFKRHCKKSSWSIKKLMASLKKDSKKKNSLDDTGNKSADRPYDRSNNTLQNTPETRDSKISEKEVSCVQYNSTWDIFSKDNNQ